MDDGIGGPRVLLNTDMFQVFNQQQISISFNSQWVFLRKGPANPKKFSLV